MLLYTSDTWLKHTGGGVEGGVVPLPGLLSYQCFSISWNGQFQYLRAVQTPHLVLFISSDLTIQCQWAKGCAPFLIPWDIRSPREESWPRENNGLSEQARALFLGFTAIQSAALWTLSGRWCLEKCLFHGEYDCLHFLPDTLFPGWPGTSSSSCHQSLDPSHLFL